MPPDVVSGTDDSLPFVESEEHSIRNYREVTRTFPELGELVRYTRAADQRRLAEAALAKTGNPLAKPAAKFSKKAEKMLKIKGQNDRRKPRWFMPKQD